jgi:hypothetical protein
MSEHNRKSEAYDRCHGINMLDDDRISLKVLKKAGQR